MSRDGASAWWDRVSSGIVGNRAGEVRWPLAAHLGEGKLLFKIPAVLRKILSLVENSSGDKLE